MVILKESHAIRTPYKCFCVVYQMNELRLFSSWLVHARCHHTSRVGYIWVREIVAREPCVQWSRRSHWRRFSRLWPIRCLRFPLALLSLRAKTSCQNILHRRPADETAPLNWLLSGLTTRPLLILRPIAAERCTSVSFVPICRLCYKLYPI